MSFESSDLDKLKNRQAQRRVRESSVQRRYATTAFILRTVQLADDLKKTLDLGPEVPEEYKSYIEDKIRNEYRECFGCELGNIQPGEMNG